MNPVLAKQLSLDYCCTEAEVLDRENHFTVFRPLMGRRRFQEASEDCFLKIAVVGGKLLATGHTDVVAELREKLALFDGAWFMDAPNFASLERLIGKYGMQIEQAHPFYIAEKMTNTDASDYDLQWYEQADILQFKDDERFDEAFSFDKNAPDMLGVAALHDGEIVGMAGASADSPLMWQIGINVLPGSEGHGVGSMLVCLLKNEILRRGVLPFYGTAMSHLASVRVSQKAGFVPAWTELITAEAE